MEISFLYTLLLFPYFQILKKKTGGIPLPKKATEKPEEKTPLLCYVKIKRDTLEIIK